MNFINILFALFASLLLANCSISDVTNLWPTGNSNEEEIVVREIPGESFDPEDTEEIIITESDAEYEDKPAQDMNTVSSVEDIIEDIRELRDADFHVCSHSEWQSKGEPDTDDDIEDIPPQVKVDTLVSDISDIDD